MNFGIEACSNGKGVSIRREWYGRTWIVRSCFSVNIFPELDPSCLLHCRGSESEESKCNGREFHLLKVSFLVWMWVLFRTICRVEENTTGTLNNDLGVNVLSCHFSRYNSMVPEFWALHAAYVFYDDLRTFRSWRVSWSEESVLIRMAAKMNDYVND